MIVGKIGETTYDKQMLLALIIGAVHILSLIHIYPIVRVIILPRKSAKLNPAGTRTANGHT